MTTTKHKKIASIRQSQATVNAAFKSITGRSPVETGLKLKAKIVAVLTHFGVSADGMTNAMALATTATWGSPITIKTTSDDFANPPLQD